QVSANRRVPRLYKEGMTDVELQVEIERDLRLEGCLGIFRISGSSMELYMGNLLVGDNADAPSPYDFAMGGAGQNPSLPVGANGTEIRPGNSVMVDMNGNFNGYMTDMTRVFKVGDLPELALKAHQCSIDIHHALKQMGKPGTEAKMMDEEARRIVKEAGLEKYFMGHRQHAGFIGHGIGIEVNELPVISPRSRDVLEKNNVIALEPKFVIPHVGAVGIENTYVVTDSGLHCLTDAAEEIISLD
ncbi:MAG: M24 family metallopeptidase, partial [Muribaculaceae bacterium]|nr:M24 family metallopeptidase [Muribaculaceae bacterium]